MVAWHWFAPLGCSVRASSFLDDDFDPVSEPRITTVSGTGNYGLQSMHDVVDDTHGEEMWRTVDSVGYLANCDAYYGGPWKLFWDVNRNGSYTGRGDSITFNASKIDGPSNVTIPVQSRHASAVTLPSSAG